VKKQFEGASHFPYMLGNGAQLPPHFRRWLIKLPLLHYEERLFLQMRDDFF